ncbi:MAG: hypothetical protein U9R69_08630 [Thermodesulfobacteriota bacterium]|nr:hypothetical protein [Thermodesulfobacteriota bacterium]
MVDGRINFAEKPSSSIDLLKPTQLNLSDVRASSENLRAGISGEVTYIGSQ